MIRLLKPQDYIKMPWKNGAGFTEQIARVNKPNSEDFIWRISIADVKENGEFSLFHGYQRVISVLEGPGMRLEVNSQPSRSLLPFDPFAFVGDANVQCTLLQGILRDFNLIYDPTLIAARLQWLSVDKITRFFSSAQQVLIFNASDALTVTVDNKQTNLRHYNTLWVSQSLDLKEFILEVVQPAMCCIVELIDL